jgi:hypothetical protein
MPTLLSLGQAPGEGQGVLNTIVLSRSLLGRDHSVHGLVWTESTREAPFQFCLLGSRRFHQLLKAF